MILLATLQRRHDDSLRALQTRINQLEASRFEEDHESLARDLVSDLPSPERLSISGTQFSVEDDGRTATLYFLLTGDIDLLQEQLKYEPPSPTTWSFPLPKEAAVAVIPGDLASLPREATQARAELEALINKLNAGLITAKQTLVRRVLELIEERRQALTNGQRVAEALASLGFERRTRKRAF